MFDGLKDMGKLLKQAKEMKSKLKDVQKGLKRLVIESNYDNKIKIKINGEMEILELIYNPEYYEKSDQKLLEKDTLKAVNKAVEESKKQASQQLSTVTGGMDLPGL